MNIVKFMKKYNKQIEKYLNTTSIKDKNTILKRIKMLNKYINNKNSLE